MSVESAAKPQRPPRLGRRTWLVVLVAIPLLLLVGILVGLVVVAHSLDRPWIKRRLQSIVRSQSGLEVDWAAAELGLHRVRIEGLVVLSPEPVRAMERELGRIDLLEASFTWGSLVAERRIQSLRIGRLDLHLVENETGHNSLSMVGGGAPSQARPATPLSRLLADGLGGLGARAPFDRFEVGSLTVTYLRLAHARPPKRYRVSELALVATSADSAGWRLALSLGTPDDPLPLRLERQIGEQAADAARVHMWATADVSPSHVKLQSDIRVVEQQQHPLFPFTRLLRLDATADFDPIAGHSEVKVRRSEIADGAAVIEAEVVLFDAGPIEIRHAHGTLVSTQLMPLIPQDLLSLTLDEGRLRFEVEKMRLDPTPGFDAGGSLHLDADWSAVEAKRRFTAGRGQLGLDLQPRGAGSLHLEGSAHLASLGFDSGRSGPRFQGRRLALELNGEVATADLERRTPPSGRVRFTARFSEGDARAPRGSAIAENGQLQGMVHLKAGWPDRLDLELPITRLQLSSGRRVSEGAARLEAHFAALHIDAAKPLRSTGEAKLDVRFARTNVELKAKKQADQLDFDLDLAAPSLALISSFLPEGALKGVPLDRVGVRMTSLGHLRNLSTIGRREGLAKWSLEHRSKLEIERFAFDGGTKSFGAKRLLLVLSSKGNVRRHEGDVDLHIDRLTVRDKNENKNEDGAESVHENAYGSVHHPSSHLTAAFYFDLDEPTVRLRLSTHGPADPADTLTASFGFDRRRRAVTYDIDGHFGGLRLLAPLASTIGAAGLADLNLEALKLSLRGSGTLLGLVDAVDRSGALRLVSAPLSSLAVEGGLEVDVAHLNWSHGSRKLTIPKAHWSAAFEFDGVHRTVKSHLDADTISLALGDHELELKGVTDESRATLDGVPLNGEGALHDVIKVAELRQDYVPGYAIEGLHSRLEATRDHEGVIRISTLQLENPGASTTMNFKGGLDFGAGRRSLSLRGELKQSLTRLWSAPSEFAGHGEATLAVRVTTGDLRVFHTSGSLHISHADVKLPRAGIALESIDGEIPLTADLVFGRKGLSFLRNTQVNTYSELRFADQHPLLRQPSYLVVSRVTTPLVTVAPLAGNLSIEQNVVSLNQLDLGLRRGRITGQCVLDWKEDDTTVQLHVRASRVESSHHEPFDGNLAAVISTRQRSVEGRAEILRIGRRHLLDLLDFQDPHHADAAVNRIRRALALGYPDRVRLGFNHGFANIRVTFGGLARLLHIDELRGVPMGPVIDRLIAPFQRENAP